ncbi:MAG: hypothetical protein Fur0010_08820 [Bdellovibrio sp.]
MVLRCILIFLFASSAFGAKANKQRDEDLFRHAKELYSQGKYLQSLRLLESRYSFKSAETPSGALILAAWDLEKLGEYVQAQNLIAQILRSRYGREHQAAMQTYKNEGVDSLEDLNPKLLELYHRRAFLLSKIYQELYFKVDAQKRDEYKKMALMYVDILANQDKYEDETYDQIPKEIEAFELKIERETWKTNFFVSSYWTSWRDRLDLVNPNGDKVALKSTTRGFSLGYGVIIEKWQWRYLLEGQYTQGSAVAGRESSTLNYFEDEVSVRTFGVWPSVQYRPNSGKASIGFSIPLMYRSGNYTEPQGYQLEGLSVFSVGYGLEFNWDLEKISVVSRFAKLTSMSSSLWQLGLRYNF